MGIVNFVAGIQNTISRAGRRHVGSFCFLETNGGSDMLVCRDGSLTSVIRVEGVKQVMGEEETVETVARLSSLLSPYLRTTGHSIQVCFMRDPEMGVDVVRRLNRNARNVARAARLDMDDLLEERERHLPKFIVHEAFHIVLTTRIGVLSGNDAKKAEANRKPPENWPPASDAQDIHRFASEIVERHRSFVNGFRTDLGTVQIRATLVDAHEAVRVVKSSIVPSMTSSDWRPLLVGDPIPMRRPENSDGDASHVLWQRLESQICVREAERVDGSIVRIGDRYWAGVDMTVGPQELLPFSTMIRRMRDSGEFPWRVSFLIEGDGLAGTRTREILASIFGMTNGRNRAVTDALKGLRLLKNEGAVVAGLRVSFATWAPSTKLDLIQERLSRLVNVVQSWGDCQVSAIAGDPLECVLSSAVAFTGSSTAPAGAVPLPDVVAMLPLDRDASPWPTGPVLFKTRDGRPWPYAPGSANQVAFIDLVVGTPGRGKSVLLNSVSLAFCLSPAAAQGIGGVKLPRIAILDIGSSSKGLISLLKESLPDDRRHEAEHFTLQNDASNSINPFGTQLGCRRPFQNERDFLVNFFTQLGTPGGAKEPPKGLADLVQAVIDEIYLKFSDKNVKGMPKAYRPGRDPEVDRALARHGIELPRPEENKQVFWWRIVDLLKARNDLHAAALAQRHAVPIIQDVPGLLRDHKITNLHGTAMDGNEALLDSFSRAMVQAPREYPILSEPTRFDIGGARVVSLDLGQVAGTGAQGDKMTALMYMLGRYVLANDFYLLESMVDAKDAHGPLVPEEYRDYHLDRIRRIRETPKRIVYDEFHRTSSAEGVRNQVRLDMREGRKWGVHITVCSQLVEDFDKEMIHMATGKWILGFNSPATADECAARFQLSRTALEIMRNRLTGPGPEGAPFLVVLSMDDGQHEHELQNLLGPMEAWAFSTTPEDEALRNRLYSILGAKEARRRLAREYPKGGAKSQILSRIKTLVESGAMQDEAQDGVIAEIAARIATSA